MTQKSMISFVAGLMAMVGAFVIGATGSASAEPTSLVSLNVDRVLAESSAGQSVLAQARELMKGVENRNRGEGERLQQEMQQLGQQRTSLSEDALRDKVTTLRQRQGEFQQKVQGESQRIQAGVQKAEQQVLAALRPILADIKQKRGADMIVNANAVVVADDDLDITSDVITALNRKLSTVKVTPVDPSTLEN